MTGSVLQTSVDTDHQKALVQWQRQAEALYLAQKTLELDLIRHHHAQPMLFVRPPAPNLLLRILARLSPRIARNQAARVLGRSGLFDAPWYLARYPDIAKAGADPVRHYLAWGAAEGRDPGPCFCTAKYVRQYPDVIAAGVNPLLHYIRTGWAEKRTVYAAPATPAPATSALAKPSPAQARAA